MSCCEDRRHQSNVRPQQITDDTRSLVEMQANAFARKVPGIRIATMRFHWVVPQVRYSLQGIGGRDTWKDLWGMVSEHSVALACLNALTVGEDIFPPGHETFFIVDQTTSEQRDSYELLRERYPDITDLRADFKGSNRGFFDCSKAERMLGWKEEGFPWHS